MPSRFMQIKAGHGHTHHFRTSADFGGWSGRSGTKAVRTKKNIWIGSQGTIATTPRSRLEQVARLLDNNILDHARVDEVREDVEYYIDANQEPDFADAYDEIMDIFEGLELDVGAPVDEDDGLDAKARRKWDKALVKEREKEEKRLARPRPGSSRACCWSSGARSSAAAASAAAEAGRGACGARGGSGAGAGAPGRAERRRDVVPTARGPAYVSSSPNRPTKNVEAVILILAIQPSMSVVPRSMERLVGSISGSRCLWCFGVFGVRGVLSFNFFLDITAVRGAFKKRPNPANDR